MKFLESDKKVFFFYSVCQKGRNLKKFSLNLFANGNLSFLWKNFQLLNFYSWFFSIHSEESNFHNCDWICIQISIQFSMHHSIPDFFFSPSLSTFSTPLLEKKRIFCRKKGHLELTKQRLVYLSLLPSWMVIWSQRERENRKVI